MFRINSATRSSFSSLIRIMVVCLCGITCSYAQNYPMNDTSITVQLVDSNGFFSFQTGFVNISRNGGLTYTAVCGSTSRNFKTASVVCRQLGHGPPVLANNMYDSIQGSNTYVVISGSCVGTESSLSMCSLSFEEVDFLCQALYVECLPSMAYDYDVVLVRAEEDSVSGIPLVYSGAQWSPICSGDLKDAVCTQLGLGVEADYSNVPWYVQVFDTSRRYNSFYCSNYDSSLASCEHTTSDCCGCDSHLSVTCTDYYYDNDVGGSGGYAVGTPFISFFVVLIVFIFISVRFCVVRSRATSQTQIGRTGFAANGTARTPSVPLPRQTTVPNNGTATSQYPRQQTSFGAEYSTPASYSAFPPSYSTSAYPPVLGSSPTAPPLATQQTPYPVQDPNLPTYEEALSIDRPT